MKKILVAGAGGFIGHHLVKRLKAEGNWVRGVDLKCPEFETTSADDFIIGDLRYIDSCIKATTGIDEVYQLAADMGGIGYITCSLANIAKNNTYINLNMLEASRKNKVKKYLYTSSACVYNQLKQSSANIIPLKEEDAYPALPEPGYGWEKLYAEQMVSYYIRDYSFNARIVRFHNVYGPLGTWQGGKEKSPAALCRKIAKLPGYGGAIDVWGDGEQTRSYMYIDDCIEGLLKVMFSSYNEPLNLGTSDMISINQLVDIIAAISGKYVEKTHDLTKPQGVRGRNSDNTRLKGVLGWEPKTDITTGLVPTYKWIESQVNENTNSYNKLSRVAVP